MNGVCTTHILVSDLAGAHILIEPLFLLKYIEVELTISDESCSNCQSKANTMKSG